MPCQHVPVFIRWLPKGGCILPAEERTEKATPKKKRDERKKGNVFKSQEIILVAGLLAVLFVLQAFSTTILTEWTNGLQRFWGEAATRTSLSPADMPSIYVQCLIIFAVCALPALLVAGLVAIVLTMAQTRGLVAMESIKPKFSKLSPVKGLKKIFSMRGIVELFKSLLKIIILGYVIYSQFMERFGEMPRLMDMDFLQVVMYAGAFLMDLVTNVSIIFAFLAAADFMYQRWQYEKDLRMTKQEIKEEYKQTEGDPQIKGKIRQKQREMSMGRMMQNVPEADVIITNPTHYAVAVRYEAGKNTAPVVLAKGLDLLALRIIKVAEENDIARVENRPLARGLYENVPLDREIPEEYFQPVAEVLAFVYSTSKKADIKRKAPTEKQRS
ncbi:MAG: flagellar biosynthesis protein FlhB [Ruminococcaceae bacterium]|nr:flagellar biosynthesis protein FlhB [Oscillospiraceae bacterium]